MKISETNLDEPQWLAAEREEAKCDIPMLQWPKPDKLDFTNKWLAYQGEKKIEESIGTPQLLPDYLLDYLPDSGNSALIVQRNSGIVYTYLPEELACQGVVVMSLEQAAVRHKERFREHFMKTCTPEDKHKLTAMHRAFWSGGVFVYIPKNVKVTKPIQALFSVEDLNVTFMPHILLIMEEHSELTFIEHVRSHMEKKSCQNLKLHHNSWVEVFAKNSAKINYTAIHALDRQVLDITSRRAILHHHAQINWTLADLYDGDGMTETTSILHGNGSISDAKVITIGSNDQCSSVTTKAVHYGKATESDMMTRAVMKDSATAIINGITKIEKGATKSNGQQSEKILMLSPKARGDANPILLIDENDVQAGHAASVGQVDKEQIYYLMSRGITRIEAERLIIHGFLDPIVAKVPFTFLQKEIYHIFERKLNSCSTP